MDISIVFEAISRTKSLDSPKKMETYLLNFNYPSYFLNFTKLI